jgi:hypothetical protein
VERVHAEEGEEGDDLGEEQGEHGEHARALKMKAKRVMQQKQLHQRASSIAGSISNSISSISTRSRGVSTDGTADMSTEIDRQDSTGKRPLSFSTPWGRRSSSRRMSKNGGTVLMVVNSDPERSPHTPYRQRRHRGYGSASPTRAASVGGRDPRYVSGFDDDVGERRLALTFDGSDHRELLFSHEDRLNEDRRPLTFNSFGGDGAANEADFDAAIHAVAGSSAGGSRAKAGNGDKFAIDTVEERGQQRPRSFAGRELADRERRNGSFSNDNDILLASADAAQYGRAGQLSDSSWSKWRFRAGKRQLLSIPGRVSEEGKEEEEEGSEEGGSNRATFVQYKSAGGGSSKSTSDGNLQKAFASLASKSVERALQDFFFGDPADDREGAGYKLPAWVPDEKVNECPACLTPFSWAFRKHHCRLCGKVVCASCSAKRKPTEASISNGGRASMRWPWKEPVRVCDGCWEKVDLRIQVTRAIAVLQKAAERVEPHEAENLREEVGDAIDAGIQMHEQHYIMKMQALSLAQGKRLSASLPPSMPLTMGDDETEGHRPSA